MASLLRGVEVGASVCWRGFLTFYDVASGRFFSAVGYFSKSCGGINVSTEHRLNALDFLDEQVCGRGFSQHGGMLDLGQNAGSRSKMAIGSIVGDRSVDLDFGSGAQAPAK